MTHRTYASWRDIDRLGYFKRLDDGRLELTVPGLDGLVDFHTHLGWTFLLGKPIDLTVRTREVVHNFTPDLAVDLDVYSGQNFYEVRPNWSTQDYLPCILYPFRYGKHFTHTLPNILWEMEPLRIGTSVSLCLDLAGSHNSERAAEIFTGEPRIAFFCCVHPKDKRADEKMEKFVGAGAKGMKIHPEIQLTPIDSDIMLKHMKMWNKISGGRPVLFHSGFNGFEPKRAREHAAIEKYEPAAQALGATPCILGHAAMNEFRKAIDIAERHYNVYLECSGQPPAHLKEMLDRLGDERLLFGSDWPVYPQALPMAKVLLATEDAPEARIRILRDNALKLLYKE
ncbi:MAG: amidohydrolase family protein [bacterium]